jgi:heterodisulfide reductase subunit D
MSEDTKKLFNLDHIGPREMVALDACMRCGECLTFCPVYDQDQRDEVTPQAKARTLKRIINARWGILGDEGPVVRVLGERAVRFLRRIFRVRPPSEEEIQGFIGGLYECSTCGQCRQVCPSGIDTVELWERVRREVADSGRGPLESQMVLVNSIRANDNPWQGARVQRVKWARKAERGKLIEKAPPEINPGKAGDAGTCDVLYFVGCTASFDQNITEVAINTVKILQAAGVNFAILGNRERCCGSILRRIGHPDYEPLALDNIKTFNQLGIKTLVTSCAGCFKTIRNDYPLLGDLKFEVLHITEYILRLVDEGRLDLTEPLDMSITYHDPCHLGRASGVYEEPRKVMELIPGLELIEMERHHEYSRCCGAGGGLRAGFPEVQAKVADARVRDAEATGAADFVTACPFCYQSLRDGIKRTNSQLRMWEITELVARALKKDDPDAA